MKNLYKQKRQEGFTIIEVLIVLAIAALILLIVFLAVPALQRSSRNNGRTADVSRLSAELNTWVANNNGVIPTTANAAAGVLQDSGNLSQYPTMAANACTLTDANQDFCIVPGAQATFPTGTGNLPALNDVRVSTGVHCSGTATVAGSPREMAVQYEYESGGGNVSPQCKDI